MGLVVCQHVGASFPCCSVASLLSNSLQCCGPLHAIFLWPPSSPGVCSNSCPLSWWCYLTISSSVNASFSSCPQSFPASESFPKSHSLSSGGPSIGATASASVFPMNIQGWSSIGSPCSPRDSQESSPAPQIMWILLCSAFFMVQLSHPYVTTGKTTASLQDLCHKVTSLLFNTLSRFVIAFLPRGSIF